MHGLAQLIEMWGPCNQWDGIGVPKPDSFSHLGAILPGWHHPQPGLYGAKEMRSALEQSYLYLPAERAAPYPEAVQPVPAGPH